MDTALTQKFPFILDRNLAKANCTGNRVCTSCDIVVLDFGIPWFTFLFSLLLTLVKLDYFDLKHNYLLLLKCVRPIKTVKIYQQ